MDVFTGISRNTTSTRFFQTLFNNLVIFPREPDQELNHGLGKFWSLTLFDEIPEFLTNFGFVAEGDLWPAAVFSFSATATCLVLMDI